MTQFYSQKEYETVITLAGQNIEQFRHETSAALANFTPTQRRWMQEIELADKFHRVYRSQFRPIAIQLATQNNQAIFADNLTRDLYIDPVVAQQLGDTLRQERLEKLIDDTVIGFSRRGTRRTKQVFHLPLQEIDQFIDAYKEVLLYMNAARELNIPVVDAHSAYIDRYVAKRRIQRQRKQILKRETERLSDINRRLQELGGSEAILLSKISQHDLELLEILALNNDFNKGKPKTTRKNITSAELSRFEKITDKFVLKQTERYISSHPAVSLRHVGGKKGDLRQLLLDVFSLENSSRNHLILVVAEYKQLYQEKQCIVSDQAARQKYVDL